jgi:hypothetical protein
VQRLWDEMREAEETIERLQKGVQKAEAAHIDAIAEAAALDKAGPASGVPAARQAVTIAEDQLAALREARKKIERELPEWENGVSAADAEIDRLISEILKPIAQALIERGRKLAEQLAPIKRSLSALWSESDRPTQWDAQIAFETGRAPLKATRAQAADFLKSISIHQRAVPDPWQTARETLRHNARASIDELTSLLK